ncbi:MAG: hypothetical protein IIA90_05105 [Chloroflexi bacterium]|nr:hypothetical protein [Chloroflexota bacterium]
MTTEEIIIAVVRVAGSLPVLVFPFPGAIIAMLVDQSDLFMMNLLHEGGVRDYQEFDKWLDQVYMVTFLVVALRWQGTPRNIAVGLYAYRLIGFATFEVSQERDVLIFFPNLFEFWFVFVAGAKFLRLDEQWRGEPHLRGLVPFRYGRGQLAAVLPVMLAIKLFQEYVLHVGRWLDSFTAVEAVEWFWRILTPPD